MIKTISHTAYELDVRLFRHIFRWNGKKFFDSLFYWITRSGDGYLYGLLGLFLLFGDSESAINILLIGLVAFSIELPVHATIKRLIKRIRPFEKLEGIFSLIPPPDKYSFPSGHTAAAFLIANVLSFHISSLQLLLFGWASLVGISRIYLGVHYPSDIIAGIILGIVSSQLGIWLIV